MTLTAEEIYNLASYGGLPEVPGIYVILHIAHFNYDDDAYYFEINLDSSDKTHRISLEHLKILLESSEMHASMHRHAKDLAEEVYGYCNFPIYSIKGSQDFFCIEFPHGMEFDCPDSEIVSIDFP